MEIKTRKKYRSNKGTVKNGTYKSRTCQKIRIGYHKHHHEGNCEIPKYERRNPIV